ncbi:MAG TPA: 50S ribosomal protein L35 [Actinomycetota bacterium]
MAKTKTHRGAAKRFRVTRSGKVLHRKANRGHLLGKKSSSRKRRLARASEVTAEKRTVLRLLGRR